MSCKDFLRMLLKSNWIGEIGSNEFDRINQTDDHRSYYEKSRKQREKQLFNHKDMLD